VYVLGFAFVYNTCNLLFCIFTILNAISKNMAMLIVFRFFAGVAGVGAITIGGGTIADLMPPERRGAALALWSLGPLFGPMIGPVAGGYLVEAKGWRWVFWVLAIIVSKEGHTA
jgi:MFS family permease